MRQAISLVLLASSLLSCSHGPDITACVSAPSFLELACSNKKHVISEVPYTSSSGYVIYPAQDLQNILNYCSGRTEAGAAPPMFTSCDSDPVGGGVNCSGMLCMINSAKNGAICQGGVPKFISWDETDNYIGFSAPDNTTLLAFCNISEPKKQ